MNKISRIAFNRCSPFLPVSLREKWRRQVFLKDLRNSDVFLVGHPKSGNTWLAYAIAMLLNKDQAERIHLSNLKQFVPTVHGRDYAIANFNTLHNPRVFRNEQPRYPDDYPKVIYLVRDPRAVLVSYYHHYLVFCQEEPKTLQEFVQEYVSNGHVVDFEPDILEWDAQVRAWIRRAKRQPVLTVTYEAMRNDLRSVLVEVGRFIGFRLESSDIDTAVLRSGFESMKQDEAEYGSEAYADILAPKERFIRIGKAEGWKSELERESIARIEKKYGDVMKHFNYVTAL
ncbi:sulfotransferase domain-containing protein [Patescibacteria group bacterium]|nr:sulfotransferase domain-containing protein [Patescibacteria group bacterium]